MKIKFKGKQYDYRIIIEFIGLYYYFSLSYRDCAEMMHKFSIGISRTVIYRRNNQHGKSLCHLRKNEQDYRQGNSLTEIAFNQLILQQLRLKELKLFQLYTKKVEEKLISSTFSRGKKLRIYSRQLKPNNGN